MCPAGPAREDEDKWNEAELGSEEDEVLSEASLVFPALKPLDRCLVCPHRGWWTTLAGETVGERVWRAFG